jgi:periplasmic protein CpxP/Spy
MMNKIKYLMAIGVGLCLLNIGLMAFIFFRQPPTPGPDMHGPPGIRPEDRPRHLIIKRLDFDEAQVRQYDTLIEAHRAAVRKLEDSIRTTKNQLYATLNQDGTAAKDPLVATLGSLQRQMELIHYSHFEDIKKLCRPDQLQRFKELTADLSAYFRPDKRR